jgi:hypothetical protein
MGQGSDKAVCVLRAARRPLPSRRSARAAWAELSHQGPKVGIIRSELPDP